MIISLSNTKNTLFLLFAALLLTACDEGGSARWELADGSAAGAPIIFYSGRDIYDQSFNESVFRAVETFQAQNNLDVRHIAGRPEDIRHDIPNMMSRDPALVVGIGFSMANLIEEIAPEYPSTRFLVVDQVSKHPNVLSVTFREEEAMHLVGIMAASRGESDKVGFLAGMALPVVEKMACAFVAGARTVNPNIELLYGIVGDSPKAWEDMDTPVALSRVLFNRGARVLVVSAGSANSTIHQIYRGRQDIFTIAMDMNANNTAPGSILTSMVKDTGSVVVGVFQDILNGTFGPGHETRGMAEGGVDIVLDRFNEALVDGELRGYLNQVRGQITSQTLDQPLVPDHCADYTQRIYGSEQEVQDYLDF